MCTRVHRCRPTQTHAQDMCTAGTRMHAQTHTHGHVCTWTATPCSEPPCAPRTVLATARPVQGPACASASAGRRTHAPAALTRLPTQAQGQGLRGPRWAWQVQLPRDSWTCRGGAPLPGPLLLKASGPAPTENKRRCVLAGSGEAGREAASVGARAQARGGPTARGQRRLLWPPPRPEV